MIHGVVIKELKRHTDERGWLTEIFRMDEADESVKPLMSYVSLTRVGVARGPHEHLKQTDVFAFAGPSTFKVYLWDNRKTSSTSGAKMTFLAGEDNPKLVIIPPGVVHAYKNIGTLDGFVLNYPDKLYRGHGRKEDVDEVRYEDKPEAGFLLD